MIPRGGSVNGEKVCEGRSHGLMDQTRVCGSDVGEGDPRRNHCFLGGINEGGL